MKLGIPVLNNYEGLKALIDSVEKGTRQPSEYVIVDNGGGLELASLPTTVSDIHVIEPGRNIGVAASWNKLLEYAGPEPILISNDDIVFGESTFAAFEGSLADGRERFVGGCGGWALFVQHPKIVERIGWYDEHFCPAYYEDCDYLLRLRIAGIEVGDLGFAAGATHAGEQTTRRATPETWQSIMEGRGRGYSYFVAKWGADSPRWGDANVKNYASPFDGKVPDGFSERRGDDRTDIAPLRYDVLNYIAERIGAKRYLEIGVSDGETMRAIRVAERWGVDPIPQLTAVQAATVFVGKTSDAFFENVAPHVGLFDLIFIDGDHRAEQVYREVRAAEKILSPTGIIVLHDSSPHTEAMQEVPHRTGWQWTGDVWKAVCRLRSEGENLHVIASDFGIGVYVPKSRGPVQRNVALPAEWNRLLYSDLEQDRARLLGLILPGRWKRFIDGIQWA